MRLDICWWRPEILANGLPDIPSYPAVAGRAGQSGSAITLFTPEDELFKCELASALADSALAAGQQASVSGRGADSDDEVGSGEEGFTALSKQARRDAYY